MNLRVFMSAISYVVGIRGKFAGMTGKDLTQTPVLGVFNASHEEALASGTRNFTPSKAAKAIDHDLALLPYWAMACNGVVVPDVQECEAFLSSLPLYRRNKVLLPSIYEACDGTIEPWGWDRAVIRAAEKAGVSTCVGYGDVDVLCRFQNRRFGSEFLNRLLPRLRSCGELSGLNFVGESHFVESIADAEKIIRGFDKNVLKRPISGSGRGILITANKLEKRELDWCEASCRKNGGLEIQRYYRKFMDFAMEFRKEKGKPYEFLGYSEFQTGIAGGYSGNFLSQNSVRGAEIWDLVGATPVQIENFEHCVADMLDLCAGNYHGFLGIDMMVCKTRDGAAIFPCVEMNFRHTMGMAANMLGIKPDVESVAWFRILRGSRAGELLSETRRIAREMPIAGYASNSEWESFAEGYLPLTPVNEGTLFHACLFFERGGAFPYSV